MRPPSPSHQARPLTPQSTRSSTYSRARQDSVTSGASTSLHHHQPSGRSSPTSQHTLEADEDLDDQLNSIWLKASAAENGAMHKDAITDLWNFIKAHPEKKARVDSMIDGTGGVYMRYIRRALASRQAEDDLRSGTPRTSSEYQNLFCNVYRLIHRVSAFRVDGFDTPPYPFISYSKPWITQALNRR